ncbi:MAG: hypothetical protein ACRDL2_13030 [Gaiellaceae bacterium]
MRQRGGDVAFYGLLVCVTAAAIALSVLPLHRSSPSTSASGVTASTAPLTSTARHAGSARGTKHAHASAARTARPAPALTVDATRGRSWVVIRARSSVGPVLYRGILEQGHRVRVRRRIVWAQVGAVGNVDVRIGRRRIELGRDALTGVVVTAQGAQPAQPGSVGVVGS